MIHFFGLPLDEPTVQALASGNHLDSDTRIMRVEALDGGNLYFLCPAETIKTGVRPDPFAQTGKAVRDEVSDFLFRSLTRTILKTIGPLFLGLRLQNGEIACPPWTQVPSDQLWFSFASEHVKDVTGQTL